MSNENTNQEQANKSYPTAKERGLKGILANVEVTIAEKFRELTKSAGSNPSRVTKELIEAYVRDNS